MSAPDLVEITVNGATHTVATGTTVAGVVSAFTSTAAGFAVARNGEVVPRSSWPAVVVVSGDRVDVLTVAPGG